MSTRNDRHRSINDRIRLAAAADGSDPNRIRRALIFQRVLARLAPHGVVLKGGFALEVRLPGSARSTKDLDLVGRIALTSDAEELRDCLEEMLGNGAADDGFSFGSGRPSRMRDEPAGPPAWRVVLTAYLDGLEFERVRVDLVGQVDEVQGSTEPLRIAPPIVLPNIADVVVEAVDVYQHAAEKFHAYGRIHAHERPSSRVKDLVDLVLLVEAGLLTDPARLGSRVAVVHAERDGGPPPRTLPQPAGDWAVPYAALAAELPLTAATTAAAYDLVAAWYAVALSEGTTT